eukprot:2177271-Pyramimonas_sp.AAC.1
MRGAESARLHACEGDLGISRHAGGAHPLRGRAWTGRGGSGRHAGGSAIRVRARMVRGFEN